MHFDAKITINFCAKFTSTFYAYYAIVLSLIDQISWKYYDNPLKLHLQIAYHEILQLQIKTGL